MRFHLLLLASWLAAGCASTVPPDAFPRELIERAQPVRKFRSIGEEIFVEQPTVEVMRSLVEAGGGRLRAILRLPQGVHPYMVVAFIDRGEMVELAFTSVYWGRIQGKWTATIEPAVAESLLRQATETFECAPGAIEDLLVAAAMVHWPGGRQVVCDGGWASEESNALGERLQPILDASEGTYLPDL